MRYQTLHEVDPPVGPGIFGLPHAADEALVHILPVPFEATVSYKSGTLSGPRAVIAASDQVDLLDPDFGRAHRFGIHCHNESRSVVRLAEEAREAAQRVVQSDGTVDSLADDIRTVDAACERLNRALEAKVSRLLLEGRIVGLLGGDHSVPFGAIRTVARARPGMGILQIDAHADLRRAYQGFQWSHASIMHNVMQRIPEVSKLVQVGIRDFCDEEVDTIRASKGRIHTVFDRDLRSSRLGDESFTSLCDALVAQLPEEVWISFDIDGLDPALCPNTGTPVPGGLSFEEMATLLSRVVHAGKKILGFDLVEVAPGDGPPGESWDATVGARVLYKLIGATLQSRMVTLSAT